MYILNVHKTSLFKKLCTFLHILVFLSSKVESSKSWSREPVQTFNSIRVECVPTNGKYSDLWAFFHCKYFVGYLQPDSSLKHVIKSVYYQVTCGMLGYMCQQ